MVACVPRLWKRPTIARWSAAKRVVIRLRCVGPELVSQLEAEHLRRTVADGLPSRREAREGLVGLINFVEGVLDEEGRLERLAGDPAPIHAEIGDAVSWMAQFADQDGVDPVII